MANTNFDPDLGAGSLQFKCTSVKVIDSTGEPSGFPNKSNNVLDPDKAFDLVVEWEGDGFMLPLWMFAMQNWRLKAYAESVGPGADVTLAVNSLEPKANYIANGTIRKWTHTIHVPAGLLVEGNPSSDNSGVYQLTVTIFANSNIPGGYDVSGFSQQPITIRVEDPV